MSNLSFDNLTIENINELLHNEKNPTNILTYEDIYNQIVGSFLFHGKTYHCQVVDYKREIDYDFFIHTTPLETRFSIGLRFLKNNNHLLRLDFGDTLRHKNNYGQPNEYLVIGPHAHLNSSSRKYDRKNVIPISKIEEFKNIKLIKDVFLEYIDYTNIKKRS